MICKGGMVQKRNFWEMLANFFRLSPPLPHQKKKGVVKKIVSKSGKKLTITMIVPEIREEKSRVRLELEPGLLPHIHHHFLISLLNNLYTHFPFGLPHCIDYLLPLYFHAIQTDTCIWIIYN